MNTAEKPTFENKMRVKRQPANQSPKTPKWSPEVKTLKTFVIWP